MRGYCLDKEELNRWIEIEVEGRVLYDDEVVFQCLLDSWRNWDVELICIATCLSQVLERKLRQGVDARAILDGIYSLSERGGLGLAVEELGESFTTYMLQYARQSDLSIEEDLVRIRDLLSEHTYPRFPQ